MPTHAFIIRRLRRGFTLIELLIVISLLVLLLAMALPAFNYITGARSVENARNLAGAMLARTRVTALNSGRYVGVLFYVDPATMRSTMTMVAWKDPFLSQEDIDPNERYKSWQTGGVYYGESSVPPTVPPSFAPSPDHVIRLVPDTSPANATTPYVGYPGEDSKPLTFIFRRFSLPPQPTAQPMSGDAQSPPDSVPLTYTTYGGGAGEQWEVLSQGNVNYPQFIDAALSDVGETQALPPGVGAQVAIDPEGSLTADRYMRTGLILFDPNGRIDVRPFGIKASSALGIAMGLSADVRMNSNPQPRTGLGLAFYDQATFTGLSYTDADASGAFSLPHFTATGDETAEEQWIDENASVSLINRAAGTLIGGR